MATVTELVFSARVEEIKEIFLPLYPRIEKERQNHPGREVAGKIFEGKVKFLEKKNCHAHFVWIGDYREQRRNGEAGKLAFHTHRDIVVEEGPSINDLANAAASGGEVLVNKEGAFALIPGKKLSFEQISATREDAKLENRYLGDLDWEGLKLDLSVQVVKISERVNIKENSFHRLLRRAFEKLSKS
jgi:hypothetical protein